MGSDFGELPRSVARATALVIAFVGSVSLWWIYFDRAAEAGMQVIAEADDPGRLGVTAYTYVHIPIVAGIIVVAAADELVIAHPGDAIGAATACLVLGGPALYLTGNALFKLTLWGRVPVSRPLALLALAAAVPLAFVLPGLGLLAVAMAIVAAVALSDGRAVVRYLAWPSRS